MRAGIVWALVATACRFGFEDAARSADSGAQGDARRDGLVGDGAGDDALTDPALGLRFGFDEPAGTGFVTNTGSLGPAMFGSSGEQGVPGISGNAIRFVSATDGAEIADATELDGFTQLTIEAWVYYDAFATTYSTFVKKEGAYILRTCDVNTCGAGNNKYVSAIMWDSTSTTWSAGSIISPQTNTWYHVASVYDGLSTPRTLKLFWDGVLVDNKPITGGTGPTFDSANPLVIGRQQISGENFLGRLDELRLWKVARTDEQICITSGRSWTGTCQ